MSDWDVRCLSDGISKAREFVGRQVKIHAKGFIAEGELLEVSSKFEAKVRTEKNGVQTLAPLERIDVVE